MNKMKYLGLAKANRNSYFKNIGAGKYQTNGTTQNLTTEERTALLLDKIAQKEAHKKMLETQSAETAPTVNATSKSKKYNLSAICTLANQINKKLKNLSTSFKKAWQLAKAGVIQSKISGVTFGNVQRALQRLTQYSPDNISVELIRQRNNEHDANAIGFMYQLKALKAIK